MPKMIPPTVGRRVWYRPLPTEVSFEHDQPFDAGIAHVWTDDCVNLTVFNEQGLQLSNKTSVRLVARWDDSQPGECAWMPYQVGQAKQQAEVADTTTQQPNG